jgi:hypothetical protein
MNEVHLRMHAKLETCAMRADRREDDQRVSKYRKEELTRFWVFDTVDSHNRRSVVVSRQSVSFGFWLLAFAEFSFDVISFDE